MKNLTILILALTLLISGCKNTEDDVTPPVNNSKPNILLVIADDIGIDATPGYNIGSIKPNMPNLQELASNGITFNNVWAYPICAPTRASIITGRYGYRTGVLNVNDAATIPTTEKTIQSYLNENTNNAYSHAIIGKWHLSNNEPNRPTQMGVGYYAGLLGGAASDYNNWTFTQDGQSNEYNGYITTKLTDLAIDWIQEQNKPWFCWLAYTAPHTPFHLPPNNMHSQGNLPTDQASIDANPMPYFMAMTESLDYEMGRLFESLTPEELDNTIIIFLGDNGTSNQVLQAPYQSPQGKGSLYQGGIHVPMIVSGKGVSRNNATDDNLIQSADLFSTIAEIAGVTLPSYEDSYSFKSLLSSEETGARTFNYSEVLNTDSPNKSGYTIRNQQYKLIEFDNGNRRFYDLLADPFELNNLRVINLNTEQQAAFQLLQDQANEIRQ